ncbi:uncharacterized protein PV06_02242 [Exophiala oligosperma]|uniref:Actin-like ATPase domain-containing protein n=1 Tax=Exophiala oligosperma TaxID=215243 RepID=A0A0D2B318_9EURO|nr:uncharacterized protein PV06_02242 [Exophiala oligosperma]KIW46576.1 hypothetical protein PV06_02242 [Exophiala oligosperma]
MASTVASAIRPGLRERQQSGSPHTPSRYISSVQSSPGSSFFRAEEDPIIIELNPRELSAGFQGESGPQCTIAFTPQNSRRLGDYRTHLTSYKRREENIQARCKDYELWTSDVKDVNLGLLDDKLERAVREAYTKHLLVDAGSARMILVLPSLVPHPVLSTILTLLFERWKYSSITLLPTPTMTIAGSGLRSGLVVEIGWEETVVTAIYEYREIHMRRTVRAMKALTCRIATVLDGVRKGQKHSAQDDLVFDFDFVEDFIDRAGSCHALVRATEDELTEGIAGLGLVEQPAPKAGGDNIVIDWPTSSSHRRVSISCAALHQACVESLIGQQNEDCPDDHEQSISQVLYRTLLDLPPDVRAICLPRIIFVGRGARIAGLSGLILHEAQSTISQHGWTAVRGKHFDAKRSGLTELAQGRAVMAEARHDITIPVAGDFVEERLSKQKSRDASTAVPITVREVSSLGAWTGASLVASLKAKSFVEIEREKFLSQGLAGAHRDLDSSVTSQRLTTAKSTERTSWTLAGWA